MDDRKNQNREPENGSGGGPKNRQTILIILICLLVSLMVMGLLNNALGELLPRILTIANSWIW